jgi:disulfide bond formation protein DsbB
MRSKPCAALLRPQRGPCAAAERRVALDGSLRKARLLVLVMPALLLAGAYVSQYGFGLHPCEMCWWQRYAHFGALIFAVLAWVARPAALLIALAALAIAVAAAIGALHAGVEYGWWQGLTACSASLTASADPLEAILEAPMVRCDVAPWSLFGISLAGWNFLLSGIAALVAFILLVRGAGGARA